MKRQGGSVALELALVLPVLLTLLTAVVFYGRLMYHYEIVTKASRDGVRYLSSVAVVNIKNTTLASAESNLTLAIVQTELSALGANQPQVFVYCDGVSCAALGAVPSEVSVVVIDQVPIIFPGYLRELFDQRLFITSRARYVGN